MKLKEGDKIRSLWDKKAKGTILRILDNNECVIRWGEELITVGHPLDKLEKDTGNE